MTNTIIQLNSITEREACGLTKYDVALIDVTTELHEKIFQAIINKYREMNTYRSQFVAALLGDYLYDMNAAVLEGLSFDFENTFGTAKAYVEQLLKDMSNPKPLVEEAKHRYKANKRKIKSLLNSPDEATDISSDFYGGSLYVREEDLY